MNKQEKIISALLGLMLVGWWWHTNSQALKRAKADAERRAAQAQEEVGLPADTVISAPDTPKAETPELTEPTLPEEVFELASDEATVTVSSHGGTVKQVLLKQYTVRPGKTSEDNPPVLLDFSSAPGLALSGIPGIAPNASYQVESDSDGHAVTLKAATDQLLLITRRIEITDGYQIKVSDSVKNISPQIVRLGTNFVSVGVLEKGASRNEILSADSLPDAKKLVTKHWAKESATKPFLVGGAAGGCGGPPSAEGMPEITSIPVPGPQKWVALKSRFFMTALSCTNAANNGFVLKARRDVTKPSYALNTLSAQMTFPGCMLGPDETLTRDYTLFVGPKKLSLLKKMGNKMSTVMEFGTFWWFCELLLWMLNLFNRIIPSYGVAIILLTILVRIIFWPLTHKSTLSMKKMQEIQPKLKEIQTKFKDDPTKLQQETWACYRENKVNPFSSCLPMLVQIPVLFALFTVLRSTVELRFAPFLWIVDLSEPENLFMGMIPVIGSLNILPILMAATMALQSYLTPSAGDPQQQKMMMIMMPCMMLFMFYGFASALSLYWTVSQALSIVQMLMMRRKKTPPGGDYVHDAGSGEGLTRQQRRAAARD